MTSLADEAATLALGESLAKQMSPGDILCLEGPLGAGKTTLVRGVVSGLAGNPGQVHSPTFSIVHQYSSPQMPVFHCDFYRLADGTDLEDLGGAEFFSEPALYCLEWAERATSVLNSLPNRVLRVKIILDGIARIAQILK